MICYRCNNEAGKEAICPVCGANISFFQKAYKVSNMYYNDGLEKASVRNISGAIESLKKSLKFNKYNTNARNLLGLCYLEVGQMVEALTEWIISKNFQPEENRASLYLEEIQQNKARLETINQTIKKYNQALLYCRQDSRDLAIIQLKKVLGLNEKLVKGHQLLALLYMQEGRLDLAKKLLRTASKIDADNTTTLRYLKEVNRRIKEEHPNRAKANDDLITYKSGNETIIMPKRFKETSLGATLVAILVGVVVGIAVFWFLVAPSIRKNAQSAAKKELVEANEKNSKNTQMISTLNEQIEELQNQLESNQSSAVAVEECTKAYDLLTKAYQYYGEENIIDAGACLNDINKKALSKEGLAAYKALNDVIAPVYIKSAFDAGYKAYEVKDYATAVKNFEIVIASDKDFEKGAASYYYAQSLRKSGDLEKAKPYYQYVLDKYPGTKMAQTAQLYVD